MATPENVGCHQGARQGFIHPPKNGSQPPSNRVHEDELDAIEAASETALIAELAGEPTPAFSEDDITKALLLELERQGAEGIEDVSGALSP